MKHLVYTCVIGGYDRVFPPAVRPQAADFVIVTDDPNVKVPGWQTLIVDVSNFASATLANRYYKMLMHRVLPDYGISTYVDGNIRLLGNMDDFVARTHRAGDALTLFPHDRRDTVSAEIATCIALGKLRQPAMAQARYASYLEEGFADGAGLVEAGIIVKDHTHPGTDQAMDLWWNEYRAAPTRDQLSLPYILWKTGVPVGFHDFNYRSPNSWFGVYPHRAAAGMNPRYADMCARAFDSVPHRIAQTLWDRLRKVRRLYRERKTGRV